MIYIKNICSKWYIEMHKLASHLFKMHLLNVYQVSGVTISFRNIGINERGVAFCLPGYNRVEKTVIKQTLTME